MENLKEKGNGYFIKPLTIVAIVLSSISILLSVFTLGSELGRHHSDFRKQRPYSMQTEMKGNRQDNNYRDFDDKNFDQKSNRQNSPNRPDNFNYQNDNQNRPYERKFDRPFSNNSSDKSNSSSNSGNSINPPSNNGPTVSPSISPATTPW